MKAACISSHQNSIPSLGLSAAVVLFAATGAHGAAITWGSATTVAGDSDVSTIGAFKYAEHWGGPVTTINGVTFSAAGTNVVASGSPVSIQPSSVGSPAGMSTAYQGILSWNWYNAQNKTATLNNLTSGHQYQSQVWVSDIRYNTTQKTTITGGPNLLIKQGQYAKGTFVADATSQSIAFTGDGIVNAIQVRDVSASWSGTTSGTWADSDTTSSNFSGLNFTAAKAQSTVAVFGDTTTAGGAVSNYNLTVGAGGASTGTVLFENTTAQSYTIGSADSTGITGTTAITKTGNGTVTFTGSNTYTGATTINAGKLVLGDAAADNFATSGVTVGANGTLAGSGTLSGTLSVSGILAPGNGGTGTLAAGTTTWNGSGGIWEFELTSPGASDKLDITGNFTKGSGSVFQFNFMNSTPLSGTYTLIDWSGSTGFLASNFSFTGLSSAYNGSYFTINGSQLDFTAVPEPTSALAGLLITAGLLRRRRA